MLDRFSLHGKTIVICGSEGLFGNIQRQFIHALGGKTIGLDIHGKPDRRIDCADANELRTFAEQTGTIHGVINNCVGNQQPVDEPLGNWQTDLAAGLTAVGNSCDILGGLMSRTGGGALLNIGSDLSLIAPDHTLYPANMVKPASYSAVKHGIIGLTRYYGTLWPNVRCNCLCPGGIDVGQAIPRNPMNRLAKPEDLFGPVALLISDASSYMTGSVVTVDGGRTAI